MSELSEFFLGKMWCQSFLLKCFAVVLVQMKLWELGFRHVAGVDEAGRGPLAGPVVAAACIIPASVMIPGKKLPLANPLKP
jgi:ribonuclease HIII